MDPLLDDLPHTSATESGDERHIRDRRDLPPHNIGLAAVCSPAPEFLSLSEDGVDVLEVGESHFNAAYFWSEHASGFEEDHPPEVPTFDDFFRNNGARRPSAPCDHCKRHRLQCFILQTTSANPNPVSCCSSCAALFRDCSLAEEGKRLPSRFETPQPVIGHLHGIGEESTDSEVGAPVTNHVDIGTRFSSALSSKRGSSRAVRKTRSLRNWFACHIDHPYPSEEEKLALATESGLSKSQLVNWLANARRRQRQSSQALSSSRIFPTGSPMPSPLSGMSPLDRWRHSPPEQDSVSPSVIKQALEAGHNDAFGSTDLGDKDRRASSSSRASSSVAPILSPYAASNSGSSSCISYTTSDGFAPVSLSWQGSEDGQSIFPATTATAQPKSNLFECTFCLRGFSKKHDWLRHERSVHMPNLDTWVCSIPLTQSQSYLVWRISRDTPECIFCGIEEPTETHFESHEFVACQERTAQERTFTRKDHLWQHLCKFHGCKVWEGWKPDLTPLRHTEDVILCGCGFCQATIGSWRERAEHLTFHFRAGLTMSQWVGDLGLNHLGDPTA